MDYDYDYFTENFATGIIPDTPQVLTMPSSTTTAETKTPRDKQRLCVGCKFKAFVKARDALDLSQPPAAAAEGYMDRVDACIAAYNLLRTQAPPARTAKIETQCGYCETGISDACRDQLKAWGLRLESGSIAWRKKKKGPAAEHHPAPPRKRAFQLRFKDTDDVLLRVTDCHPQNGEFWVACSAPDLELEIHQKPPSDATFQLVSLDSPGGGAPAAPQGYYHYRGVFSSSRAVKVTHRFRLIPNLGNTMLDVEVEPRGYVQEAPPAEEADVDPVPMYVNLDAYNGASSRSPSLGPAAYDYSSPEDLFESLSSGLLAFSDAALQVFDRGLVDYVPVITHQWEGDFAGLVGLVAAERVKRGGGAGRNERAWAWERMPVPPTYRERQQRAWSLAKLFFEEGNKLPPSAVRASRSRGLGGFWDVIMARPLPVSSFDALKAFDGISATFEGEPVAVATFGLRRAEDIETVKKAFGPLATVRSRHVEQVKGIAVDQTHLCLLTEPFSAGQENLKLLVANKKDVAAGLLRGLIALHEAGVVHGDLCPSNIHLGDSGVVTIARAGYHVLKSVDDVTVSTRSDEVPVSYQAPEVAVARPCITTASDVFSFSVILFEILSGAPAWPASSLKAWSRNPHLYSSFISQPANRPVLPDAWPAKTKSLLSKGWDASPSNRPPIAKFAAALFDF